MTRTIRPYAAAWAVIALCVATVVAPSLALANNDIASRWDSMYAGRSSSHQSAGCQLCHVDSNPTGSGSPWNAYGNTLRPLPLPRATAAIDAKLLAAEPTNSDGDPTGATNLEEILQSTQPGRTGSGLDPPPATLSIDNVSATESNAGTTAFVFTVSLSASRRSNATVQYVTKDNTATSGSDYVAVSGTLVFNPGQTTRTITVSVNGDTTVEPNETFFVDLSNPSNATIAAPRGTGTIMNDDVAALPTLSINDVSINEGNSGTTPFVFMVTLSATSTAAVTVSYTTTDGTATAGTDYVAKSGTLTFNPGQTTQTITVNVNGDTAVEPTKMFFVDLSGPSNATIAVRRGTGTIVNDDGALSDSNANFEGLWYNAPAESEAGWGINLAHQGDVIFATWFTYDVNGKAWWLTMTANKTAEGVYSGQLIRTNGTPFSAFVPPATVTPVGTGTLTFTSATTGTFAYTVNDGANVATQTKTIVLQAFGPVPKCVWGTQPDLHQATNYQDLWYKSPAESEAGWGLNLTHQGTNIFATWFTYDANRNPLWLSALLPQTGPKTFSGALDRTTGPAFNAVPFNPALVHHSPSGTATVTFTDGTTGTFTYNVDLGDGVNKATQTKAITRQVFRAPGTVCQ